MPPPPPIIWDELGTLVPIQSDESGDNENPQSEDLDVPPTWHDVALSIAAELMGKIRSDIYTTLGYSTSAVSELIWVRCNAALAHQKTGYSTE